MVIDKVYETISFKQSKWLETYTSFTTQKRNKSKNDFEEDFFKVLSNVFFGKMLENIRHRLIKFLLKLCEYDKIFKQ